MNRLVFVRLLLLYFSVTSVASAGEVRIVVYAAYGTSKSIYINGRVLEKKKRRPPRQNDSWWRNLRRISSELESDEVPDLLLKCDGGGSSLTLSTDSEGLFDVELKAAEGRTFSAAKGDAVTLSLAAKRKSKYKGKPVNVVPQIVSKGALIVVSDIDDTIMKTGVSNRAILVYRLLARNASQVEPVQGMSLLYKELKCPVFYLSGSPVNLHERIQAFMQAREFPPGPMFLKNVGDRDEDDSLREQKQYKMNHLKTLMRRLPGTRFLLFGDSGEQDAQVYTETANEYKGRVVEIFIRRVSSTVKSERIPEGVYRTEDAFDAARRLVRLKLITLSAGRRVGESVWGENPIPVELLKDLNEMASPVSNP